MANKELATRQRMRFRVEPSQAPVKGRDNPGKKTRPAYQAKHGKTKILAAATKSAGIQPPIPASEASMFAHNESSDKPDYAMLARQLASILEGERNLVTNAAQFSAFIFSSISDLNWAGFYFCVDALGKECPYDLLLGPFQGKVACTRIPFRRGVCGTSAAEQRTLNVQDVHAFPDHIACDSASNSEIVIPLIKNGELFGVFDIDSPRPARFSDEDQSGLEHLLAIFGAATDFR